MKEYTTTKQGTCAVCNSENIDYQASYNDADLQIYEIYCIDCKNLGQEVYKVEYLETTGIKE